MRFFNRQWRALVVTALVLMGAVCGSNGDNPPALVGQWVDMTIGGAIELFKDGTVVANQEKLKWKTEGKRFMLLDVGGALVVDFDYNLSGYELTLTSSEAKVVWVKKDKVEEYKKKNGASLSMQQGCLSDKFVKVVTSANVYAQLDPKSDIIMQVKNGTCLCLLSKGEFWYKVEVDGKDGFLQRKSGTVVDHCGW